MMTVLCDFSYGQKTTNKGDVLKKGTILGEGGCREKAFAFIAHLRYIYIYKLRRLYSKYIKQTYLWKKN